MKSVFVSIIALVSFSLPAFAGSFTTKEVSIGLNSVYIPGGFDSNSDVFVVVNGIFPNGCYKWGRAEKKDVDTFNHEISSVAEVSQGMCIMVLVPFQKEVRLGKFAAGKHNLRFLNGDGTYIERSMVIE